MSDQKHLHGKLGDLIYECKKRLFQRLKANLDVRSATALFTEEIRQGFAEIVEETESANEGIQISENLIS